MKVKKQQLELDMEKQTGSKSGKEYVKAVYCHLAYLTYKQYIMRNSGLNEAQARIKIARKNINNITYTEDMTIIAESKDELKSLLMKVKQESWLKTQHSKAEDHGIWFHQFTANKWGNNGKSDRLYFGGLQNHC